MTVASAFHHVGGNVTRYGYCQPAPSRWFAFLFRTARSAANQSLTVNTRCEARRSVATEACAPRRLATMLASLTPRRNLNRGNDARYIVNYDIPSRADDHMVQKFQFGPRTASFRAKHMSFFSAQEIWCPGFSRTRRDILIQRDQFEFRDYLSISDSRKIYVVFIFQFCLSYLFSITYVFW
jgi:hypothetical protein